MRVKKAILAKGILTLVLTSMSCMSYISYAGTLSDEEIAERVRAVSKTLRCAVCQSESVWESNAPLAAQMRDLIHERVKAGESDEQIRAYFVSRYGDFILLEPRVRGANRLLWFGPPLFLLGIGTFLFWKVRRWTKSAHIIPTPLNSDEKQRMDEILHTYTGPTKE